MTQQSVILFVKVFLTYNKMKCYNAIAIFNSVNVKGEIKFHQCPKKDGCDVYINLYGLKSNTKNASHI